MKGKVLIILTGSTSAPLNQGAENKTGVDIRTLMEPMEIILNAGFKVSFATPEGKTPIFDPHIIQRMNDTLVKEYKEVLDMIGHFDLPMNIGEISEEALSLFDGLLLPGGFGVMSDLVENPAMRPIIKHFTLHKKPIAAIAEGVLGLTYPLHDEEWIYKNVEMTCTQKSSEKNFAKPFKKEKLDVSAVEVLELFGAKIKHGKTPKKAFIVEADHLITGQDKYACEKFGQAFKNMLTEYVESR